MSKPKKIIVTSRANLKTKYASNFTAVRKLLINLAEADKKKDLDTMIVYIDDPVSAEKAGITAVSSITQKTCKNTVDALYKKWQPAYLVLFGAQDIIPFQEIKNPADDDDKIVPLDLPYACDAAFGNNISSFTGPTRVVGRIPDIPGMNSLGYVTKVINTIIKYKPVKQELLMDYFAVTAAVWKKSTQLSLNNMFGNNTKLKESPPSVTGYPVTQLKPLVHFYNCHGAPIDAKYYGQKGNNFPIAMYSKDFNAKISFGTVVAAECCYGNQLFNPEESDNNDYSIASIYFLNSAIAFVGSSTIAYGPANSNGLADLITQYYIKNILAGASSGRAMLEARQNFLTVNGPQLDPFELKTLAQFDLFGDPSIVPAEETIKDKTVEAVENRRFKLFNKGINLRATIEASIKVALPRIKAKSFFKTDLKDIFKKVKFSGNEKERVYKIKLKSKKSSAFAKAMYGNQDITYRTYTSEAKKNSKKFNTFEVLVLKESGGQLLGWKLYHRK